MELRTLKGSLPGRGEQIDRLLHLLSSSSSLNAHDLSMDEVTLAISFMRNSKEDVMNFDDGQEDAGIFN
jgi:hypothetical protein